MSQSWTRCPVRHSCLCRPQCTRLNQARNRSWVTPLWTRIGASAALNPSMALDARWRWCSTGLDGIDALWAEPVLHPVGGERDSARAGRLRSSLTKYQQMHPRRTAGIDHRCPKPRQHALLCQHQPRRAVALRSFAHSPVPSSPIRPAACAINASTCSGRCSSPLATSSRAPRATCPSPPRRRESFDGLSRLAQRTPCAGTSRA